MTTLGGRCPLVLHSPPTNCRRAALQVLSPTKKGVSGTSSLNAVLQSIFNPDVHSSAAGGGGGHATQAAAGGPGSWREGDRVVQLVNNYDDDVYNGTKGCWGGGRGE